MGPRKLEIGRRQGLWASSGDRPGALVWVMVSSFGVVLDCESANASPMVPGLNATARPNTELALRKRRGDASSGRFVVSSLWEVLDFPVCAVIVSILSAVV